MTPERKTFEAALTKEWQDYNKRGAATVDALEDNTQELTFAKGFFRGHLWTLEFISQWLLTHSLDYLEFGEAGFGATINEKKMIEDMTKEIQK